MPHQPAAFRRMRDYKLPINSSSDCSSEREPADASASQYTLQVTPGGTPIWETQPWHYIFRVSVFRESGMTIYPINRMRMGQGAGGKWALAPR
jgi:hypothetical protein